MSMDPIITKNTIEQEYRDYLISILTVRNNEITQKAEQAIKKSTFVKGPYLETTPPFKTGRSLRDLHKEGILSGEFEKIASEIHYDRALYLHQETAIRKITSEGKNIIVATGTGSGKTECYFLPIFDSLMKQAEEGTLNSGVQALLLFPMNALANDQLKKLRQLLAHYPQITFGRYTGESSFDDEESARREYEQKYNESPLPNECLSRPRMQNDPPHLLLTNYSMLEYLLLRPDDSKFFDGLLAKNWRFLIIDEAHTYKGANGTEIALLLRRLKERISHNTDRKLRCIATSATLGNEDAKDDLAEFATSIFGEPFIANDIITSKRVRRELDATMSNFSPEDYLKLRKIVKGQSEEEKGYAVWSELVKDKRIIDTHNILENNPRRFDDVADHVFKDLPTAKQREDSLSNMVELATLAKPDYNSASLLPARYHLFIKSLEGMFVSLYPDYRVYLDRKERIYENGLALPVFELANCQHCGQEYIIGKTSIDGYLHQVSEQEKPEYYLFSLQSTDVNIEVDDDAFEDTDINNLEAFDLCASCGKITHTIEGKAQCCSESNKNKTIHVYKLNYSGRHNDMNTCAVCGSVSASVVRRFLTSNHAATFAIANSLYSLIPPRQNFKPVDPEDDFFSADVPTVNSAYNEESGRKLLIFSDNRQEAAFFAGYMNNKYNQLMWRRLMLKELQNQPNGMRLDDLMSNIVSEADRAGLFQRISVDSLSDAQKKNLAAMYVMYEFIAIDKSTGLEGRGYVEIFPEKLKSGSKWELTSDETWDVLRYMMDTLRTAGACIFPDQVNVRDEFFFPRNRDVFFRKEKRAHSAGKEILSFIPEGNRKNKRLKYIMKLLEQQGVAEEGRNKKALKLLDEAYQLLSKLAERGYFVKENLGNAGVGYSINFRKWYAKYIPDDTTLFCCDKCGQIATYNVLNICSELKCTGKLIPIVASSLRSDPYYSGLYTNTKIIPMIAKEHTAQLTKEAAGDYQHDFENGNINVLSCSTTFEMGVDVGELEATFLRNVPPETTNYIQRAGRAGRRTSSTAFSVTFARRNSHDINYFNHPSEIINGKIHPPYIEVSNDKIALRHVNSVIFAWFFKRYPVYFRDGVKALVGYGGGVSAPTVLLDELSKHPAELIQAIKTILPQDLITRMGIETWQFVELLVGSDGSLTKAISIRKEELEHLQQLRTKLFEKEHSTKSVESLINTYREEKTINFLASNGVLPKYGFPIDVVSLNILNNSEDAKRVDLSRDLRLAIAEFAPPSSVVANGKVWKSSYINTIPGKGWPVYNYFECSNLRCKHISPPEELAVLDQDDTEQEMPCPLCSELMRRRKFLIPIFGFSTSMEDKPKSVGDNRPQHGYSNRIQFWGIGNLDTYQQQLRKESSIFENERVVKAEYSPNGKLVVLNRGKNGAGLWVCQTCGFVKEFPTEPKHKNKYGYDCVNTHLLNASLGHSFTTDVLRLEMPYHLNPFVVGEKDVRLSVLYAILDGAADALGISRNDISGCIDYDSENPAIIIFDESSGGAGHVKKIFENLSSVLNASLRRVNGDCGCSDETSCYGCLRSYENQYEHEKLTRGGAKEYLTWLLK